MTTPAPRTATGKAFHDEYHEDWATLCGPDCPVMTMLHWEEAEAVAPWRAALESLDAFVTAADQALAVWKRPILGPTSQKGMEWAAEAKINEIMVSLNVVAAQARSLLTDTQEEEK